MAHKDPDRRRKYEREAQRRHRARRREDADGTVQLQLRESAFAGMTSRGTPVTCRFSADDAALRADLPEGSDWCSVGQVWVPEVPVARIHDALTRLRARDRQVTLLALIPSLSAPQDWPILLAAVEAAGSCVLVERWIRQRPAAVLGFGVDGVTFAAAWKPWGVVLHGGVPQPVAVQRQPPSSPPRREPAPSAGVRSPFGAAALPDAEVVPTPERTMSPPQANDDPVERVHLRVFGTHINSLPAEKGRRLDDEIQKVLDNLADRGIVGDRAEDEAVRRLRSRPALGQSRRSD